MSPISRNQLWILDIALEKVYPLLDKTVPKFGKAHCLLALKNSVIMLGRLDLGYYTYQNSAWHKVKLPLLLYVVHICSLELNL